MTVLSGDIVRYGDRDLVVVDVTGDIPPVAVLRTDEDVDLRDPVSAPADQLTVVGHLEHLDGWVEDDPGIWSVQL
jgi:hypothetical protein